MIRILVAIIVAIPFLSPAQAETRSFCDKDITICTAHLEGAISTADVSAFRDIATKVAAHSANSQRPLLVDLNSKGGDIRSAMEIGKILRQIPISVAIVSSDDVCESACVFVLAGASARSVRGKIGIHRPYSTTTAITQYQDRQREFTKLGREIKDFLDQMNIPASLYDEIMRIPPEKIKFLSKDELQRFGLAQNDPAFQDSIDSDNARSYGLSKTEYLTRKAQAYNICLVHTAWAWRAAKTMEERQQALALDQKCEQEVISGARKN